jgi:hypothetical protein
MRYESDECKLFVGEEEVPISDLKINGTVEDALLNLHHVTWQVEEYKEEFKVTGTMILEYNPRFWIITPFERIKYYLKLFRYKFIKKLMRV